MDQPLDEVVAGQDVDEGNERHDRRDGPRELGDETEVAPPKDQVDPDQHHGNGVQDAEDDLDQFLHAEDSVPQALCESHHEELEANLPAFAGSLSGSRRSANGGKADSAHRIEQW
jgi:hypothetical protein